MKYVIVGGVAGGATAAARIRRLDEMAEIIILEKGKYISYANCGLPYYIGDTIKERQKLLVQTPQSFHKRFAIDVRVESEAIKIDTSNKKVTIRTKDGQMYDETFDKLLLSPGATPVRPPLKGIDIPGIFTLRNVDDTDHIKTYIIDKSIKNAVIVGAGFIGLEMAENLHQLGINVSIIEMGNQVMAPIDFSMACAVHQHLIQKGVNLYLGKGVDSFEAAENGKINITLNTHEDITADMVLLSIGVRPETTLAKDAGIILGEAGGIKVNEFLETSAKDIYAVGDAIEYINPLTGKPYLNYLAGPANRQGRIVADNMVLGNTISYEGAIATSIAKVFDMTVATTGLPAKRLQQMNVNYSSSIVHPNSHAGYYPNALPMTLKLTFNSETGKIYGAQCTGYEGVDKRIDEISMVIKQGGSIYDLMKTEQCYAPPFSSAKDPVAVAAYVAGNIVNGTMPIVTWREIANGNLNNKFLLDVRTTDEFSFGSIQGAVNIPLDEIRERINEIPKEKEIYIFCAVGLRGYLATRILMQRGYQQVKNLSGGYKTYQIATAKLPTPNLNEKREEIKKEEVMTVNNGDAKKNTVIVDACGLQCPGPVLKIKHAMDEINQGDRIEVTSTDAAFSRDAQAWCNTTGNKLLSNSEAKGKYTVIIEKGAPQACHLTTSCEGKGKTLIMFSDDLDKALATFVLANGAAAIGQPTTIFFTFWGLNVIKKMSKPKVEKDIFGKMFGWMLPSHSLKLHLSKMSMLGIGDRMMRHIMKQKNIESLETLRQQAIDNGVEFIACQMSMDVMGVKKEELLDNVTIGGVASYMERAEQANVNLFI